MDAYSWPSSRGSSGTNLKCFTFNLLLKHSSSLFTIKIWLTILLFINVVVHCVQDFVCFNLLNSISFMLFAEDYLA